MSLGSDAYKSSYNNSIPSPSGMGKEFEDSFDSDKNSDTAKTNLKNQIEYVKSSSENRKNKNVTKGLVNEQTSEFGISSLSLNSTKNTQTTKNNAEIALNKNHVISKVEILNIARILEVYNNGVNIENLKLIYNILYRTIFSVDDYDLISMLKVFDNIFEIRNNVLYPKNEFKVNEQMDSKIDDLKFKQEYLKSKIYYKNEVQICLNIEQPSFFLYRDKTLTKKYMVLLKIYNPSLFYLQLCNKIGEFGSLMKQMQTFYETENKNYLVEPSYILPGSCYASSYTSFSSPKQWYRLRVLREVNSTFVEIIHVDHGTVDNIPKTELRFLKHEFCNLPCQAIHCCLTGYNELEKISPEVTKAFIENFNMNEQVYVMIDDYFIWYKKFQILHVTLCRLQTNPKKIENINDKLTIWHLQN